jgi:hypothetical protein
MQRHCPGLITDYTVRRHAAPSLKRSNGCFGVRAEDAVNRAGGRVPLPGRPVGETRCRLRTTSPLDPSVKVGIGLPFGRAAQVAGPTMPSMTKPAPSWKSLTAVSVFGPNTPSTARPRSGVRRKARCTLRTTSPVAPGAIVGCPGLGKGQSPFDKAFFTQIAKRLKRHEARRRPPGALKNYRRLEAHRRTQKPLHISPRRRVR